MGTFNTYGYKSKKYGGAYPVWLTVSQKQRAGGTLDPLPPVGTIIRAGTLVNIESSGGKATIVETFLVKKVVTDPLSGLNTITVRGLEQDFAPKDGMELMVAPNNTEGLFSLSEIENVTYDEVNQEYSFSTISGIDAQAGDILVRGIRHDNGVVALASLPTGLTENDVWIEDGDEYATVASVYHGEIMEDRIQPIPQYVKKILTQIRFEKGV